MTLGAMLREMRVLEDMTLVQLGELLKCTPAFISNIERGKKTVSLKLLKKYSKVFYLPVSQILYLQKSGGYRVLNEQSSRPPRTLDKGD